MATRRSKEVRKTYTLYEITNDSSPPLAIIIVIKRYGEKKKKEIPYGMIGSVPVRDGARCFLIAVRMVE